MPRHSGVTLALARSERAFTGTDMPDPFDLFGHCRMR